MAPASTSSKAGAKRRHGVRGPANREALLAAAHRLVLEHGEDFTTQDLIKEADVALQTFYRHFGSKDQLLLAVIADLIRGHCESLTARAADLDDPVERLHLFLTETLATLTAPGAAGARFMTSQHWRLHQIMPDELAASMEPFAELVAGELDAGRERGVLAPRDPERDAWLITRLVISVFHHHAFAEADSKVDTIADDVWRFCLAAVRAG